MKKVITYGTYDLLHYGHIKLLERAKALGDYLVVGVTADDFDRTRGKINVQQSLMERIESVRRTGLADEIIVEEYEGQKIDDIKRHNIDIFTVGSDWEGKFDYLGEYCEVVYLKRTDGISSSELRSQKAGISIGIKGYSIIVDKFINECSFVNGVSVRGICCSEKINDLISKKLQFITDSYDSLLEKVDAVYIVSHPREHYADIKKAIEKGKHILCESPIALNVEEVNELFDLAKENNVVICDAIKTAYSTAYSRLILLAKSGRIGEILSVDSRCTSLKNYDYSDDESMKQVWNSMTSWGPTALLPVFQLLGDNFCDFNIVSKIGCEKYSYDELTKVSFVYNTSMASILIGKGAKSEGELVITGSKGYIYVPAPWWQTDYFEIRYENQTDNKRYFYQLDGQGVRNEILSFIKSIENKSVSPISKKTSLAVVSIIQSFYEKKNYRDLQVN